MKFFSRLKARAKKLKNEIIALSLALKDDRTPWYAKAIIVITISYALSPIDLVPDFIPVLGYLDDLVILPLLIIISIKLIPAEILNEHRVRAQENTRLPNKQYNQALHINKLDKY